MAAHAAGMLAPGALVVPSHVHVQAQVGLHVTPVSALCLCLLWCSISSSWSIGPQWYCNMPAELIWSPPLVAPLPSPAGLTGWASFCLTKK